LYLLILSSVMKVAIMYSSGKDNVAGENGASLEA
jgi:hypothetical protein